jgi:hypothetical protein
MAKQIITINGLIKEQVKDLFKEALLYSYSHVCQIYSTEKGCNRVMSDMPFIEMLENALNENLCHKTIIYRKVINEDYDLPHYEFGISSINYFIEIRVRLEDAEKIIEKY